MGYIEFLGSRLVIFLIIVSNEIIPNLEHDEMGLYLCELDY